MRYRPLYIHLLLLLLPPLQNCHTRPAGVYPQRKDIVEAVYASGKIIADNEYSLFALCNGTVLKKLVKDGDMVRKADTILIVVNDAARERVKAAEDSYEQSVTNLSSGSPLLADLKLSVQNAAIKVQNDSATYYRWKRLWEYKIGTRANLDNTYSNYLLSLNQQRIAEQKYYALLGELRLKQSTARSSLTAARQELRETAVLASGDGIVYQTFKEAGETVHLNEIVAQMGDRHNKILRLAVDQQDINAIRVGQQVLAQADITEKKIYEAVVSRIYPVMNEADQTFRVDAEFKTLPPYPFIHGSVQANIIIQHKKNALILPRNALADNDSVYAMIGGKPKKVWVKTGIHTFEYAEILTGIDEKTMVLLKNE